MPNTIAIKKHSFIKPLPGISPLFKLNGKNYPLFSAIIFLVIYGMDIVFCIDKQLFTEAFFVAILTIFNISVSLAMNINKKYYNLIPLNCFINFACISALIVYEGFGTGIYFYFVPTAVVYMLFASDKRRKLLQIPFFIITALFATAILAAFKFSANNTIVQFPNLLFTYRLAGTLIFTAILLRLYLPAFINKENFKLRKNYFETLFQSPQCCYIVFNASTNEIVDYNKTTSLLFELPLETPVKGLYLSQFMMRYLAADSNNIEIIMNGMPDGWQGDAKFITYCKNEFSANVNVLGYISDEQEFKILCIQDISTIKKSEKQLLIVKENLENSTKVKSRFLSSISHELRTPLNGIIGTVNLLMDEPGITEHAKQQLKLQLYSSEHMLSIINDILDFSKIDSGKMELHNQPFNIAESMQNTVNGFKNQFAAKKIELLFEIDKSLADIYVNSDEVKLQQILNNLLSNALKFTLDGSVTFNAALNTITENTAIVDFKVTDTGIGISEEKHAEIFEGFTQVHADDLKRRFGGTGLGLAISQKIANLFGAAVQVKSNPGKGSCFYFSIAFNLHVNNKSAIAAVENNPAPKIDIRGVRILIVEDNEINAAILKTFLTKWGVRIMEASHGIQAIELLKYHKFDMIFMDLEMPEMNGYAATEAIRKANNMVPVIAFTATLLENMDTLILEKGFNDYILKPFKPAVLKGKIEKFAPHRVIEYA